MCYIFVNGIIEDYDIIKSELLDNKLVIACDGGLWHIDKLGIKPDVLIGDFDSVSVELLEKYKDVKRLTYPTDKNYTDTELAIKYLCEIGIKGGTMYGATGGRLDHTFGNVYLLKKAYEWGFDLVIKDNIQEVYFIKNQKKLYSQSGRYLSILPLDDVKCGASCGLKYQLNNLKFSIGDTLSISNIVIEEEVEINFNEGCGIIFINKENIN